MENQLSAAERMTPAESKAREMYAGYTLLAVSLLFYVLVEFLPDPSGENIFTIFFIHYFLALGYTGFLIYQKAFGLKKSWKEENIHSTMVAIVLFLVSAYALNRVVNIFQDSTPWLCMYLTITTFSALSYRFYHSLPGWVNRIQEVILGSALLFYLYLSLFVANVYVLGTLGMLAFGIGAHIFVPLILLGAALFLIRHTAVKRTSKYWILVLRGEPDFCLINVITADEALLFAKIEWIFENRFLTAGQK